MKGKITMKDEFIKNKLADIEKEKEEEKTSHKSIDMINNLLILLFSIVTVEAFFFHIPAFLPSIYTTMLLVTGKIALKGEYVEILKKFDHEKRHLENISEESPKSNGKLNLKRKIKIGELQYELKENKKYHSIFEKLSYVCYAILGSLGVAAITLQDIILTYPNLYSPFNIISLITLYTIFTGTSLKINENIQQLDNRIANIKNDLKVIEYDKADKEKSDDKDKTALESEKDPEKINIFIEIKTRKDKIEENIEIDGNEELVQQYIDALSNVELNGNTSHIVNIKKKGKN